MHGQQGVGGIKAINRPSAKARDDAGAIEGPATAVEHDRREVLQTPMLLQRAAVRCDAFVASVSWILFYASRAVIMPIS